MKHIFLLEDDETLGRGIAMALTGTDIRHLPFHLDPGPRNTGGGAL